MAGWLQEEQVAAEENKAALEAEAVQIEEAIALSHQVIALIALSRQA